MKTMIKGITKAQLKKMYRRMTLEEIASEFDCSKETIRLRMKSSGLERRKQGAKV